MTKSGRLGYHRGYVIAGPQAGRGQKLILKIAVQGLWRQTNSRYHLHLQVEVEILVP